MPAVRIVNEAEQNLALSTLTTTTATTITSTVARAATIALTEHTSKFLTQILSDGVKALDTVCTDPVYPTLCGNVCCYKTTVCYNGLCYDPTNVPGSCINQDFGYGTFDKPCSNGYTIYQYPGCTGLNVHYENTGWYSGPGDWTVKSYKCDV
ncbi:MAG: hypothetical protein BYD32DRAFT_462151 [Podila humilis]|nr:MAG: hypothetical protein BYD32DRAFT_462151 [Podila humilis]